MFGADGANDCFRILSSTKTRLVGALEREGHDWIGKDLGLKWFKHSWVEVSDDPASVFKDADAIVDFSAPKASVEFSKLAAERGIACDWYHRL